MDFVQQAQFTVTCLTCLQYLHTPHSHLTLSFLFFCFFVFTVPSLSELAHRHRTEGHETLRHSRGSPTSFTLSPNSASGTQRSSARWRATLPGSLRAESRRTSRTRRRRALLSTSSLLLSSVPSRITLPGSLRTECRRKSPTLRGPALLSTFHRSVALSLPSHRRERCQARSERKDAGGR